MSAFFKAQSDKVRTAASICLGNLTIGNTDFFLDKVFGLLSSADQQDTQLFMNTIREIIIHNPKCLETYLVKLIPLLLSHSVDQDDQIRNIVAESIGRLYSVYPASVGIDQSFQSTKVLERRTIAKSFKYAASKEADYQDLMMMVPSLIDAVGD